MPKEISAASEAPKSFREIRYEEKKDAIIRTAIKAFGKKGFGSATIEEMANEIKMTKGSLYYYFGTKEELLYEAHLLSLKEVIDNITKINETSDPPEVKLRNAIIKHLDVLARNYEGVFLLQQEYILPEHYRKEVVALRDLYESQFTRIIEEGVKAKRFSVPELKISAYCMLGAINWFLRWYSSSGRLTAQEIGEAFADFFFNGLLTGKERLQGERHGLERGFRRRKNSP